MANKIPITGFPFKKEDSPRSKKLMNGLKLPNHESQDEYYQEQLKSFKARAARIVLRRRK